MTYSDTGSNTPSEHLYTNQTHPYFRGPHIYISMPGRILFDRHTLTVAELEYEMRELDPGAGKPGDCSDGIFLTTRAGSTLYDFTFRESFMRPGIGYSNWTSRNNYPARGVVQTGPNEMSMYVQRDYGQSTGYLQRMTMRLDGFASVNALNDGGDELEINYSTSAAGSIKVEIQDAAGVLIPGHSLDECHELIGDEIERTVAWRGQSSIGASVGTRVRLRFVMRDADLYSIRFE